MVCFQRGGRRKKRKSRGGRNHRGRRKSRSKGKPKGFHATHGECEDYFMTGVMNNKSVLVLAPIADRGHAFEWTAMHLSDDGWIEATIKLYKSGRRRGRLCALREIAILNELSPQTGRVPKFYDSGSFSTIKYAPGIGGRPIRYDTVVDDLIQRPFVIIESLPITLYDYLICTASPKTGCQPTALALNIAEGCIAALAAFHQLNFVHRGVCPQAFALRPSPQLVDSWEHINERIVITDMSLARPYPRMPERRVASFVGAPLYCSSRAHALYEHRPSDDYISVVYMLIEMLLGRLPWWAARDNRAVNLMKRNVMSSDDFVRLPRSVRSMLIVLNGSGDQVDVAYLYKCLDEAMKNAHPESNKPDCVRPIVRKNKQ